LGYVYLLFGLVRLPLPPHLLRLIAGYHSQAELIMSAFSLTRTTGLGTSSSSLSKIQKLTTQ
jgi:hypothetical protein